MANSIGVMMAERIVAGVLDDNALSGELHTWPTDPEDSEALIGMPAEEIVRLLRDEIVEAIKRAKVAKVAAIGLGLPGIVGHGTVLDSPNLPQLKGERIREKLGKLLHERNIDAPISVNNDADVTAAGVAATKGELEKLVRVWTLGNGVGFGRYPCADGIWEGGHQVVTLDSKETFCGCGGRGHLEGVCGYRAMRLRFLDMEPEEIFAAAKPQGMKQGDPRCVEFVKMYHRALAAGTANSIYMEGPGKFYFTGFCVDFLDLNTLKDYLQQMVKMSPLQSYQLEVIPQNQDLGVIGAAVIASKAVK
jgi:predicted NBD/HSP70 family sugar kinase